MIWVGASAAVVQLHSQQRQTCNSTMPGWFVQDEAFQNFTRLLLKVSEHTWGIDTKQAPQSWDVWNNTAFRKARVDNPLFAIAESSWQRQAEYIQWGVEARTSSEMCVTTSISGEFHCARRRSCHWIPEHVWPLS